MSLWAAAPSWSSALVVEPQRSHGATKMKPSRRRGPTCLPLSALATSSSRFPRWRDECIYDDDPDLHFAEGGVIEALDEAKRKGLVRFTGHMLPRIHLYRIKRGCSLHEGSCAPSISIAQFSASLG
ncbi:Hypothetical protein A7982_04040 [Minicystis rosea]|nr:Hypothetical protein A7982_04040 [Minicystis rosea]